MGTRTLRRLTETVKVSQVNECYQRYVALY